MSLAQMLRRKKRSEEFENSHKQITRQVTRGFSHPHTHTHNSSQSSHLRYSLPHTPINQSSEMCGRSPTGSSVWSLFTVTGQEASQHRREISREGKRKEHRNILFTQWKIIKGMKKQQKMNFSDDITTYCLITMGKVREYSAIGNRRNQKNKKINV